MKKGSIEIAQLAGRDALCHLREIVILDEDSSLAKPACSVPAFKLQGQLYEPLRLVVCQIHHALA